MSDRPPPSRPKLGLNKPIPVVPLPADPDKAPISVAPESAEGAQSAPPQSSTQPADTRCLDCQRHLPVAAIICSYCAYDRRKGLTAAALARKQSRSATPLLCPKCQYSLVGLTTQICPECGERFSLSGSGRIKNRKVNETYQKRIWIAPSVMMVIALPLCVFPILRIFDPRDALALTISLTGSLLGGVAGYATAAVLLTGWPYTVPHALYRIAAVLLMLTAFRQVIPVGLLTPLTWIIAIVALYFLIINFLDTDARDAGLVVMCMIAGNFLGLAASVYAIFLLIK